MTLIMPGVFLSLYNPSMGYPNKFITVDTTTRKLTRTYHWNTLELAVDKRWLCDSYKQHSHRHKVSIFSVAYQALGEEFYSLNLEY